MKVVQVTVCVGLVAGLALQVPAVGSDKSSLLPEGFDVGDTPTASKTVAAPSRKVLSAEGLALKDDIKVEYGEGHGETTEEAVKEALRDVLQKVVGVYVDSDFRMDNDEIIKDEIITHSNGFIDHYKKMEESDDANGRGKVVTVKAWVKMRDFVNRMKKIAPSQTVKMDGALLDNDLSNKFNAETLLKKEFESFNPALDLLEVRLAEGVRPAVRDKTDATVTLRYVFQVRYSNTQYYKKFIPRITRVLDQIAETTPRNRNMALSVKKVKLMPLADIKAASRGGEDSVWRERPVLGALMKMEKDLGCKRETKCLHAVTAVNGNSATIREWRLSERLIDIYKSSHASSFKRCKAVSCTLALSDAKGNILSQASSKLSDNWYVPYGKYANPEEAVPKRIDFVPFMGPWAGCYSSYELDERDDAGDGWETEWYDSYVGCIDITIDRKDVSKISTAEVKLETENQGENK